MNKFEAVMKVLFYICIFSFLTFALRAVSDTSDGFLARWAASLVAPHAQQMPSEEKDKDGEILKHAEISPVIPSAKTEILKNPAIDPQEALKNKDGAILEAASIPGAREELQKQESIEDLQYGPIADKTPNNDESLLKADLDLKVSNPNPNTDIVRNAAPTA